MWSTSDGLVNLQLSEFLVADGVVVDAEVGHVGLRQVFVATEGSTAYPAVGGGILEYICEDGHVFVPSNQFTVKEQFTFVALLTVKSVNPHIALGLAALHDDLLVLIAAGGCLETLLVQAHGHVGSLVGAVLCQLGEGKEKVAVTVKLILGTNLEMDRDGEVAKLANESAGFCSEVVIAVIRS